MPDFGELDPRQMPPRFFRGAELNYRSARKANISRQNCGLAPRFWYIDATITCRKCGRTFVFSTSEQQYWYEGRRVSVDAFPRQCSFCRKSAPEIISLRQQYDSRITGVLTHGTLEEKRDLVELIDVLSEAVDRTPAGILENRRILGRQIDRLLAAEQERAEH